VKKVQVIITCEHGGNRIPGTYARYFAGRDALLESHEGYDAGALTMAREFAHRLHAPLVAATVSRLLVDLNRSLGHPDLHAKFIASHSDSTRNAIIERYYRPYRDQAEDWIMASIGTGHRVIHLSSHSFTPVLHGDERTADVGLLYDPVRQSETSFCLRWQKELQTAAPALKVRRNYPYRGNSDGFTAYLRNRFPASHYLGIELEINQRRMSNDRDWSALRATMITTFQLALDSAVDGDEAIKVEHGAAPNSAGRF
jgi:predicted N-formylglutamate amidohydrolase